MPPLTRQRPWLAGVTIDTSFPVLKYVPVATGMVPVSACVPVQAVDVPYSSSKVGVVPTTLACNEQSVTAVVPDGATSCVVAAVVTAIATVDFGILGLRHASLAAATTETEPLATVEVIAGLKLAISVPAVG